MPGKPSTNEKTANNSGLIRALVLLGATATILLVSLVLWNSQSDPYIDETLNIQGSITKGDRLFRMNCAGCHGVKAKGLLAPNLQEVTNKISDKKIINQIVKGTTPPMPRFEMEAEDMADLISYLHSFS